MFAHLLFNYFGRFWSALSNIILLPLYIKYLGFEAFSIIAFTVLILNLVTLFDLGISQTFLREMSKSNSNKKNLFRKINSIYIFISTGVFLAIFLSSDYIGGYWVGNNAANNFNLVDIVKIFSFDAAFQMLFRFYISGLVGLDKQVLANVLQILFGFARNALVIILIYVYPFINAFFIYQAIISLIFVVVARKVFCVNIKSVVDEDAKIDYKEISKFSAGVFLISFIALINTQLDKILISKFFPIELLGAYTLTVTLCSGMLSLVHPISTTLLPKFTRLITSNEAIKCTALFEHYFNITVVVIWSTVSVLICYKSKIILLWTGDINIYKMVENYFNFVVLSYAMLSLAVLPYNLALANGFTRLNNLLGVLGIVLIIPSYFLAMHYVGIIGVVASYCIVQSLTTLIYVYCINKKFVFLNTFSLFFKSFFVVPLAVGVPVYLASLALASTHTSNLFFLLELILTMVLGLAIGSLILFRIKSIKFQRKLL